MVDAIISPLLDQLISLTVEEAGQQVRLVVGVEQEVEKLKHNLRAIQAVLVDAELRQVKEETVRLWLDDLKDTSDDMEDVLDEWITARLKLQFEGEDEKALVPKKKVRSFFPASCFGFKQIYLRRDISLKIRAINEKLDDIARQKDMFNFNVNVTKSVETLGRVQSISLIDESEICGRDFEKEELISKLLSESSEEQKSVQIISIVGMGGIGKTTLAQIAYNNKDVKNHFDKMMWVCVSEPFDEFRIAKSIIEGLQGETSNLGALQSLVQCIYKLIVEKKFLLILDDVWTEDHSRWEPFHRCLMNGLRGSRILVTTRKETVARMMESTDVISIEKLSEQECWSLFKRLAFFNRPPLEIKSLEEIGRKIVVKCKGLPLAAKTIGSLLRFKTTNECWHSILNSELWKLEEFIEGLLAPLLLSYNDLPTRIRRCFIYCAVFPKDSYIEKDELVKLWMAQNYIEQNENKAMELIGGEYFDYLATRSFFQEFHKDDFGNINFCKMHDMVHDFAKYLSKNECFSKEVEGREESLTNISWEKLRHSKLVLGYSASFPVSILNAKKLRSLLIDISFGLNSPILIDQLTCLRAVQIVGGRDFGIPPTFEISKEIGKLIHLRYIKLYRCRIEELPETCCELLNLQTLDLAGCSDLKRLPQEIGKLVNLRHLIFDAWRIDYLPKGIERLTCLRTLTEFIVSRIGGENDNKACNLKGLRYLNHLRGRLNIRRLGNVIDIDEAKNAELDKKTNIVRLTLNFDKENEEEEGEEDKEANHQAITEALKPPPDLEHLTISRYAGKITFHNWIASLDKLKRLCLINCNKCEILPPLGKLPSLEELEIKYLGNVKRVGDEFLGIQSGDGSSLSSSQSASVITAFPKLKHLTFRELDLWEEWEDFGITRTRKEDIRIMPQLKSLKMSICSKLKSLPDQLLRSITLKRLQIFRCDILEKRFEKETGEDWSKISHIPIISLAHIAFFR